MHQCDTVLLIDDHPDLREGLGILLGQEGYAVETATNGREALIKLYSGLRPCLIVMDLMMPVMNGFEFRQRQLSDTQLAAIPVVAYSGVTDPFATAQQLQAAAYFHKPTDPEQLAAAVRQICPKRAEPEDHR